MRLSFGTLLPEFRQDNECSRVQCEANVAMVRPSVKRVAVLCECTLYSCSDIYISLWQKTFITVQKTDVSVSQHRIQFREVMQATVSSRLDNYCPGLKLNKTKIE